MLKQIALQTIPVLVPLLQALLLALLALLFKWVRGKAKNDRLTTILTRSEKVLGALVSQTAQVLDNSRGADGRLDATEAAAAKAIVIERFKSLMGVKGLQELAFALGFTDKDQLDSWVSASVEDTVRKGKTTVVTVEPGKS